MDGIEIIVNLSENATHWKHVWANFIYQLHDNRKIHLNHLGHYRVQVMYRLHGCIL